MEENLENVLVIDSDEKFCKKAKRELKKSENLNCSATTTKGDKGLELIFKKGPDFLVMDLILPHLDGISILDELKEKEMIDEINIIIFSSFLSKKVLNILQDYEIDYFMSKPADFDNVKKRIKDLSKDYKPNSFSKLIEEASIKDNKEAELNLEITDLLDEFGVPANIRGYLYLRNAIYLSITDLDLINSITKKLYPTIADNFSTAASRVERAIRHAIKVAWERGNQKLIDEYFGYSISETIGRPTNAQFIAKVADNFRLRNNIIN